MSEHKIQTENLSPAPAEQQHGQTERSQELGSNPKTTEFTIDRSRWYRGHGPDFSALLRIADGQMCCLGFYSLACGLTEASIEDQSLPSEVSNVPTQMEWLQSRKDDSIHDMEEVIALVNDNESLGESDREAYISGHFANHGIKINFIDGGAA